MSRQILILVSDGTIRCLVRDMRIRMTLEDTHENLNHLKPPTTKTALCCTLTSHLAHPLGRFTLSGPIYDQVLDHVHELSHGKPLIKKAFWGPFTSLRDSSAPDPFHEPCSLQMQ
jgi:hypothetical protein